MNRNYIQSDDICHFLQTVCDNEMDFDNDDDDNNFKVDPLKESHSDLDRSSELILNIPSLDSSIYLHIFL